ncbi:MAG: HAMP domain-containing histidine kinase [Melioribacter sp.]|nr:HAMP domain-containing histidine kinase [Melioribacter sp.]
MVSSKKVKKAKKNPSKQKKGKFVKRRSSSNSSLRKLQAEFISSTSHQFFTPLTTILSSVELLEYYIKNENYTRQQEIINKIKRSIANLTHTLEGITNLYKYHSLKQKLNLKNIPIRKFVNDLLEEVVVNIGDSILIIVNIEPELNTIYCDEFILKQILLNLIHNAVKFSPDGGQIRFDIKKRKNGIEFSVKDEGIGIAKSDLRKLFNPFFRGKNATTIPGAGLGLAIVKNLSQLLKAKIQCVSNQKEGTEFKVLVPN